jgi:hypothetical protein
MKRIIVDPDICNGKPVLDGTRIPVQTVLGFLSAGDSIDEVLKELHVRGWYQCFDLGSGSGGGGGTRERERPEAQ